MKLKLLRYSTGIKSTLGILYIGNKFECYTLEDTHKEEKVHGETRIDSGIYVMKLRKEGGMHSRYSKKFKHMHKGMLWLQNVDNFKWVYMHYGNDDEDTEGCMLVGNGSNENITDNGMVMNSVDAYQRIYPRIAKAIEKGENVIIEIINYA